MALMALVLVGVGVLLVVAGVRGDLPALWQAIRHGTAAK